MITTMADGGQALYMFGMAICCAVGFVFCLMNLMNPGRNWRRAMAWTILPILNITLLSLTKFVSNLDNYWQTTSAGKYEKLPQSLWWRSEFVQKETDGTLYLKRTEEKSWTTVFRENNAYSLSYGISNPEEEREMLKKIGLTGAQTPKYPSYVVERLVIQTFGRHGTNTTELARDLLLQGITMYDLEPIATNLVISGYTYY